MRVEIHAQTVNQMMNADVIYADQVRSLPDDQQKRLLEELTNQLRIHSDNLVNTPVGISPEQIRSLAVEIQKAAAATPAKSVEGESRGAQMNKILGYVKDSLGGVADIVLTAVKLAQVIGVLTP